MSNNPSPEAMQARARPTEREIAAAAELLPDYLRQLIGAGQLALARIRVAEALTQAAAEATERADKLLADVDGLIAEYGIDTVGTGSAPSQKEQRRVDDIVEAAMQRHERRSGGQHG